MCMAKEICRKCGGELNVVFVCMKCGLDNCGKPEYWLSDGVVMECSGCGKGREKRFHVWCPYCGVKFGISE